ncbi:MAG TPA: hypothetical protein VGY31_13045 [Terriglobia bacterium]|nr:hypothetical protein [Terriglobia bacterium]
MEKGESLISIALTALLVLVVLGIQRRWNGAVFRNMASSAEDFVLKTTGLRESIPDLPGDEKVRTFRLGQYAAALYRSSPAPLVFAAYHFILFDSHGNAVFRADTLEASATPWTTLYDFNGRRGLPDHRRGGHALYTRDLTGDGSPDILLGQYSGGEHCCTTVTVIELDADKIQVQGKITGLDGLPFEGLEIHRLDHSRSWQLVAHRPYRTVCGLHADAADVVSVYAYVGGKFSSATPQFQPFLNRVLKGNLAVWNANKSRSLHLLQSVAADYATVGQPDAGEQFVKQNLPAFSPQLTANGSQPQACLQDVSNLINSVYAQARRN